MTPAAKRALEAAGFAVEADPAEFLGLTAEERKMVELRLSVARAVRRLREERGMTPPELARRIGVPAAAVAQVEAAADVPLDVSFRALFALGGLPDLLDGRRAS